MSNPTCTPPSTPSIVHSRLSSLAAWVALCVSFVMPATPALAQAQDANPLRLIVPYPPGGGTDRAARPTSALLDLFVPRSPCRSITYQRRALRFSVPGVSAM
jgi:hypothetical protein